MLTIFGWNFEIEERFFGIRFQNGAKGMHYVDLGESFPTSIYLQNLASIQPRTSLVKFARSPRKDPPGTRTCQTKPGILVRNVIWKTRQARKPLTHTASESHGMSSIRFQIVLRHPIARRTRWKNSPWSTTLTGWSREMYICAFWRAALTQRTKNASSALSRVGTYCARRTKISTSRGRVACR